MTIDAMIKAFENGVHSDWLRDIYLDESMISWQQERYAKALNEFKKLYGDKPVEIYSAPGRSEVGGNHTDHQYGMVLATSVNLDAIAVIAKRDDNIIRIKSEGYPSMAVEITELKPDEKVFGTSYALVKGVLAGFIDAGYQVGGFDAYITSNVLNGAGLSSSAAFEVLIGTILSGLYNDMKVSPVLIAQIGQFAENVYFGKPCGLMDQTACSVGGLIHIDFEDPKKPIVNQVKVDFEKYGYSLCIVDTKGSHADLTDEYAAIPREMKEVAVFFDKPVLRQVDEAAFYEKLPEIREGYGDRGVLRTIHLFEENKRVAAQVEALEKGDFESFKELIKASGNSSYKFLQNIYVNKDWNNQSVSIGLAVSETILGSAGVCRVHGGGFAGTIQAFVPNDMVQEYKEKIEHVFGPGSCYVLKVRKYGGVKVL